MKTQIVWNGCDNYIEVDLLIDSGLDYEIIGGTAKVFKGAEHFESFNVAEINIEDLPKDEDGEPDLDGVLGSQSGKFYKAL